MRGWGAMRAGHVSGSRCRRAEACGSARRRGRYEREREKQNGTGGADRWKNPARAVPVPPNLLSPRDFFASSARTERVTRQNMPRSSRAGRTGALNRGAFGRGRLRWPPPRQRAHEPLRRRGCRADGPRRRRRPGGQLRHQAQARWHGKGHGHRMGAARHPGQHALPDPGPHAAARADPDQSRPPRVDRGEDQARPHRRGRGHHGRGALSRLRCLGTCHRQLAAGGRVWTAG